MLAHFIASQEGPAKGAAELESFANRNVTVAAAQDVLGQLYWAAGRKKEAVLARILARELYKSNSQTGRAEAMSAWLKGVDPDGKYEQEVNVFDQPRLPPKSEHRVLAFPKGSSPLEAGTPRDQHDGPPPPAAAPRPIVKVIPLALLPISPDPLPFAPGSSMMTGSGIVLEGGRLIITNRHVIDGMHSIAVRNGTGHVRNARIVKVSDDDDLALLEIDKPFPEGAVTSISDIVEPATGRAAIVMGFPMIGLLGDEQPALTDGIVAKAVGLGNDPNTFQMTTKINKGNSGGPVFDKRGHLLGVAVGKTDTAGIYQKSGVLIEDMNIGIKGGRILKFLGKSATTEIARPEMSLEDLYQQMLPRAVLIAAQK
jgi:S1-C subfamily serine protease